MMIMILTIEAFCYEDAKNQITAAICYYRVDKSILAYLIIYYANANPLLLWFVIICISCLYSNHDNKITTYQEIYLKRMITNFFTLYARYVINLHQFWMYSFKMSVAVFCVHNYIRYSWFYHAEVHFCKTNVTYWPWKNIE